LRLAEQLVGRTRGAALALVGGVGSLATLALGVGAGVGVGVGVGVEDAVPCGGG